MKIVITEEQANFLKENALREMRDASMYSAKADAIRKQLDNMYKYLPIKVEKGSMPVKEWTIVTLDNGMPFRKIHKNTMFYQMQRKWKDLCGDKDERDKMLKQIQDEWLADQKKIN